MPTTVFFAKDDDVEVLLRNPALLEWVEDHFGGFVGPAVLIFFYYQGHRFEKAHLDRAVVLGAMLNASYREWRKICIKKKIPDNIREDLSHAVAKMLVGQEEPFVKKIERIEEIEDARSLPIRQLRGIIARRITQADCPEAKDLWGRLSARYDL